MKKRSARPGGRSDEEPENERNPKKRPRLPPSEQVYFDDALAYKTWLSKYENKARKCVRIVHSSKAGVSFVCKDKSCNAGGYIASVANGANAGQWKLSSFVSEHKDGCEGAVFGKPVALDDEQVQSKSSDPAQRRHRKSGVKHSPNIEVVKTEILAHNWLAMNAPEVVKLLRSQCDLDCHVKQTQRALRDLRRTMEPLPPAPPPFL